MRELLCISELLYGRPNKSDNKKEEHCYDILDSLHIDYQRIEYNYFPKSMDELKDIDKILEVDGIKNLIFRTKNKSQYFFIIIPREEKLDEKSFRAKHNLPKITMVSDEELGLLLDTCAGTVSIMDLINDKNGIINVFIEKCVLDKKYFRFHPNENKSTVRIKMEDFINLLMPYLKHNINIL